MQCNIVTRDVLSMRLIKATPSFEAMPSLCITPFFMGTPSFAHAHSNQIGVVRELPPHAGVGQGGVLLAAQQAGVVVEVLVAVGLLQLTSVAQVERVAARLLPVRVDDDLVDVGGAVVHLGAGDCLSLCS